MYNILKRIRIAVIISFVIIGYQKASSTKSFSGISYPIPNVTVPIAAVPPVIDGDINDAVWKTVPILKLLYDGGLKNPSQHLTEVRLLADDNALYMAFDCREDRMNKLSKVQHDYMIFNDDSVEIFLHPGREIVYHNTYHLVVNVAGLIIDEKYDDLYTKKGEANLGWNADTCITSVRLYPDRWTVEIILPWVELGIKELPREWRLNLHRNRPQKGKELSEKYEDQAWSSLLATENYVPERFGYCIMETLQENKK